MLNKIIYKNKILYKYIEMRILSKSRLEKTYNLINNNIITEIEFINEDIKYINELKDDNDVDKIRELIKHLNDISNNLKRLEDLILYRNFLINSINGEYFS